MFTLLEGSRAPSPMPSLQPAYEQEQWSWHNHVYNNLEDAVKASGASLGIDDDTITWMNEVLRSFIVRDIAQIYNLLGEKMYEHKNSQTQTNERILAKLIEQKNLLNMERDRATRAQARVEQLEGELATLKGNQQVLVQGFRVLDAQVKELVAQQSAAWVADSFLNVSTGNMASASGSGKPKVGEPPKYKGNKTGDLTLEQWLQKIGIWFRHHDITKDDAKIVTALMYLEGGAHSFMDDYVEKASAGLFLGSWQTFVDRLKSGYRQMSPKKSAQQSLQELCTKQHSSMAAFAKKFRLYASKSGYSDVELISRIADQRSKDVRLVMVTMEQQGGMLPSDWEKYLDIALEIEMRMREDGKCTSTTASSSAQKLAQKNPEAMDIDTLRKPEKLSKEQEEWLSKGLCFRCGKHRSLRKGEKCRTPQYKGFYELPARPASQTTRVVEESSVSESSDKGKGKEVDPADLT